MVSSGKPQEEKNLISIVELMKRIPQAINPVLKKKISRRYVESILLMYSAIENQTRWVLLQKLFWDKINSTNGCKYVDRRLLVNYVNKMSHDYRLGLAYSIDLYSIDLYDKLLSINDERNNIVHQLWMFEHKNDQKALYDILENAVKVSNEIAGIMTKLCTEMGTENCNYFQFNESGNLDAHGLEKLKYYKRM